MEKFLKVEILDSITNTDIKIIKINGELVMSNSNEFKQTYEQLIEKGCLFFVVDLTGLKFIDSIGTLNLINLHIKVKRRGGNVRIFGVNANIIELFNVVGLTKLIPPSANLGNALFELKQKKES